MGRGCGKMGGGVGEFWTGKMRSHCGMEGGGNVAPNQLYTTPIYLETFTRYR